MAHLHLMRKVINFNKHCNGRIGWTQTILPIRNDNRNDRRCMSSVSSKNLQWNQVISEAEKVVGYSIAYLNLKWLLGDEVCNIAVLARKLVGTGHPILKTIKAMVSSSKNSVQMRGLVVLLMAKAALPLQEDQDPNEASVIRQRQQSLAEIVEMFHMSYLIHNGMVNTSRALFPDDNVLKDMIFGNKIAILFGDYLLSNCCKGLAAMRNSKVLDLLATATVHFSEAGFFDKPNQSRRCLVDPCFTIDDWTTKNTFAMGTLMANGCEAMLELASVNQAFKQRAHTFGKHVALAWQAHSEMQPFVDDKQFPPGSPFNLKSAPIIFHLQEDERLVAHLEEFDGELSEKDYKQIHDKVVEGARGIEKTKELYKHHTSRASQALENFPPSDAKTALNNILKAL